METMEAKIRKEKEEVDRLRARNDQLVGKVLDVVDENKHLKDENAADENAALLVRDARRREQIVSKQHT